MPFSLMYVTQSIPNEIRIPFKPNKQSYTILMPFFNSCVCDVYPQSNYNPSLLFFQTLEFCLYLNYKNILFNIYCSYGFL